MKESILLSSAVSARGFARLAMALSLGCGLGMAQVRVTASNPVIEIRSLSTSGAAAETSEGMQGPVLGYVFESATQSLLPILGIAGSSHLGNPIQLGLSKAVIAPGQDSLLGTDGNGDVRVIDLRTGAFSMSSLAGADRGVDQIVFSPSGRSAALYERDGKQVQLVKGLPEAPQVKERVSLASLPGILTALAVNDEGTWLLAAVSEQSGGSLHSVAAAGGTHYLAPAGNVSGLAFLEGSNDALVADHGRNEVVLLRNVSSGAQALVLASERDGLRGPVAVAASADGTRAFAALGGSKQIASLPLQGGVPTFMACDCTPTTLGRMRGPNVFRMTENAGQAVFLFDASNADPRVWFVPPAGAPALPASDTTTPRATRGRGQQ
jgi:hypothetical protein